MEEELENLNLILADLERKKKEKEEIKEELIEEIELMMKEIESIHYCIKEKIEKKKVLEQEVRVNYDDVNIFGNWNFELSSAAALAKSSSFLPSILKGRIIPVNNEGIPVEELGESKWTRKRE